MLKILKPLIAHENLILRLTLAFTFLWSGFSSLYFPENWIGFIPDWAGAFIDKDILLGIHAVFEIAVGIGFIIGLWTAAFALIGFLSIIGILIFAGIDDVTFRDVGLAIIAFILFIRSLR